MTIRFPGRWEAYELIDSGGFEKLECFGPWVTCRPEPQAVWKPALDRSEWERLHDVRFIQDENSSGFWEKKTRNMPDRWTVNYREKDLSLEFRLSLTSFKHIGLFPEQAENWSFIYENCKRIRKAKVLNLFAYTGGASLAARAAGADVIHCDAIRQVVSWAKENMKLS